VWMSSATVFITFCAPCEVSFLQINYSMSDWRLWPLFPALVPTSLPPFRDRFRRLLNLLNCDVMISIMQLVLSRTTARWSKSWSEAQFEMVMEYIWLILIEISQYLTL